MGDLVRFILRQVAANEGRTRHRTFNSGPGPVGPTALSPPSPPPPLHLHGLRPPPSADTVYCATAYLALRVRTKRFVAYFKELTFPPFVKPLTQYGRPHSSSFFFFFSFSNHVFSFTSRIA